MFSPIRIAQIAAYFAGREPHQTINVMKLVKLMYLADRESLDRFGEPITFDSMVSMDEGPVLSRALNMMNGESTPASAEAWGKWLTTRTPRVTYDIKLRREFTRADLDYVSDADLQVLKSVAVKFGHMTKYQLRDYVHEHCPEWEDPHGTSIAIDETELLRHLGKSKEDAAEIVQRIAVSRTMDRIAARR